MNTRLPCITNDGGMIIVTGPRHEDILPRLPKGIAGRSNVQHRHSEIEKKKAFHGVKTSNGKTEGGGQRTEDGRQRSEVRGQRTEDRRARKR